MFLYLWLEPIVIFVLSLKGLSEANDQCNGQGGGRECSAEESSTFKALIGHTFKRLPTKNPEECHERCQDDIRCQSWNFVIRSGVCELNNRNKQSKPTDLVHDMERFYMKRWPKGVILGSVAELPADSCEDIKLSEDGKVASGTYWLDPARSGNISKVYCDMTGMGAIENSVILSTSKDMKQTYIDILVSYLGPVFQSGRLGWEKCYQATVHGWGSTTFHSKCNFKGPTITIVRYGNYIFGGYTSIPWKGVYGSCGYRKDTKAFLFTLNNTNGFYPEKLAIIRSSYATYDCYSYNPTFGGGHDIRIYNQASYSYVSCHSYTCPKYQFVSPTSFKPNEVEVFYKTTPSETLEDSAILSANETMKKTYLDKLVSYLAPDLQSGSSGWKKCYQATVHGWSSVDFHYRCNFKGPTVSIIRFGNYIFGGYTSKSWQAVYGFSCQYRDDTKAFLFTLHNTNGYYPEKLEITRSSYAIYDCYSYNPTFGGGHDIRIYNQVSYSYVSCYSYTCPKYQFVSPTSFKPNEVEVFYETTPPETIDDSAILVANVTMKQTYLDKLASYLAPVLQSGSSGWKKCYQATVHGWASTAFHSRCNYKGPTVTIARFGSYVFGGYTSILWKGVRGLSCGYRGDTKAFLFTLHNTNGYYPEKLAITRSSYAIYDCYSCNPTFGGGFDIRIYNQASYSYVSCHSYTCPKYQFVSPTSFKPNEVEVFYETTN